MKRYTIYYMENNHVKAWDVKGVSERDARHAFYAIAGDYEIVKAVRA